MLKGENHEIALERNSNISHVYCIRRHLGVGHIAIPIQQTNGKYPEVEEILRDSSSVKGNK